MVINQHAPNAPPACMQNHIRKFTDQTSGLVSLLQLTLTGQNNLHAMQAELRAQRQALEERSAHADVLQHIQAVEDAASAIAAAATPADVHAAMQHVEASQVALSEQSAQQLASVHRSMQHSLSEVRSPNAGQDRPGALPQHA